MKTSLQDAAKLLSSLEIWIVTGAVALSMVMTSLLPWAVLLALLFWPVRWIAYGRPSKRTPVDFGIALLLIMIPVTLWATALPEKTIPQVYRLALGILFFYALINWTYHTQKLGWIISGIILAGFGLAGMAIFSVQFATTKLAFIPAGIYQRFELLVSDTVHPNVMAGNIVIILPIGIALLLFSLATFEGLASHVGVDRHLDHDRDAHLNPVARCNHRFRGRAVDHGDLALALGLGGDSPGSR